MLGRESVQPSIYKLNPALSSSFRTQRSITARCRGEGAARSCCMPHYSFSGLPRTSSNLRPSRGGSGRIHSRSRSPCAFSRTLSPGPVSPVRTHSRPFLTSKESLVFQERGPKRQIIRQAPVDAERTLAASNHTGLDEGFQNLVPHGAALLSACSDNCCCK